MPRRLPEEIDNWIGGINTAAASDSLPLEMSPRGVNTAFIEMSKNPPRAKMSKRKGASEALDAPLTSEPTILGQYFFRRNNGTKFHVLLCGDGSVRKRLTDGTSEVIATGVFTPTEVLRPCFAVANDYLFFTIGTAKKKFDGTAITDFGMGKPSAPAPVAGGTGGSMTAGAYAVLITYRNAMDSESQRSDEVAVTITAGQKITVSWSAPADTQVTHVRCYIRQDSRGPNFYRVVAGATPAPDANIGGWPTTTLSVVLDITDVMFENMRILAPDVNMNFPPPTGCSSPTWHLSRMFVHDGKSIYWSEVEKPEQFYTTGEGAWQEPINPDDGASVVALHAAHNKLLILKNTSSHALVGRSPSAWEVEEISPEIGVVSQQAVVTAKNRTYWWDREQGPVSYMGNGPLNMIGSDMIGPNVKPAMFKQDSLDLIHAVYDNAPDRQRVMWAVPDDLVKSRCTLIFPYNVLLEAWESIAWNPFDVASMAVAEDDKGTPWVFMGGYAGKLFQWWNAYNDGVPEGEIAKGKVASATATTLACLKTDGTSPGWTVNKLKELYVYAISADGVDVQRKLIASNTADTLTLATSWGTTPNSTYTFVVGGIDFQLDTPWMKGDASGYSNISFHRKRYEKLFLQVKSRDSGIVIAVDMFFSYNLLDANELEAVSLAGSVVYADVAPAPGPLYDVARYVSSVQDNAHIRVSHTGFAWRARLRNIQPDEDLVVLRIAMRSVLLSTNR